jgi:hypothetical protein
VSGGDSIGVRDRGVDAERLGRSGSDRRAALRVRGHDRDRVSSAAGLGHLGRGLVPVADLLTTVGRHRRGRERTVDGVPGDGAAAGREADGDAVVVRPVDLQVVELAELHPHRLLRGLRRLALVTLRLVAGDVRALVVLLRGRLAERRRTALEGDVDVGLELALDLLVVPCLDRDLARALGLSLERRAGLDPGAVALEDEDRVLHRRPGLARLRLDGSERGTRLGDLLGLLGHPHDVVGNRDLARDAQALRRRVVVLPGLVAARLLPGHTLAVLAERGVTGLDSHALEHALAGSWVDDLVPVPGAHLPLFAGSGLDLLAGHGLDLDVEEDLALLLGLELGRGRDVIGGLERGLSVLDVGDVRLRGVRRGGRETGQQCQHGEHRDDGTNDAHCCSPFR